MNGWDAADWAFSAGVIGLVLGGGLWFLRFSPRRVRVWFLLGLSAHLAGSLVFVHRQTSQGGDAIYYFKGGRTLLSELQHRPPLRGDLLGAGLWTPRERTQAIGHQPLYYGAGIKGTLGNMLRYPKLENLNMARIVALLSPLVGGSFVGLNILLGQLGFLAIWALFQWCRRRWRRAELAFALLVLFLPSVIVWTSGLLKTTFELIGLALILWAVLPGQMARGTRLAGLLGGGLLLLAFKGVLFMALVPVLGLWGVWQLGRQLALPGWGQGLLLAGAAAAGLAGLGWAGFGPDYLLEQAYHTRLRMASSYVPLAEQDKLALLPHFEPSWRAGWPPLGRGLLQALFRPLPWQSWNLPSLVIGVETSLLWLGLIGLLFQTPWRRLSWQQPPVPLALALAVFSLGYLSFVGLSTPYIGTLARYRLPALWVLALAVVMIWATGRALGQTTRHAHSFPTNG